MGKPCFAMAVVIGVLVVASGPAGAGGRGGGGSGSSVAPFTPPGLANPTNKGFGTFTDTNHGLTLSLPLGWSQGSASWKSNLQSTSPDLSNPSLYSPPGLGR